MAYTGKLVQYAPERWGYFIFGPNDYCHQPSKQWRTKAMATSAMKRAIKRKIMETP